MKVHFDVLQFSLHFTIDRSRKQLFFVSGKQVHQDGFFEQQQNRGDLLQGLQVRHPRPEVRVERVRQPIDGIRLQVLEPEQGLRIRQRPDGLSRQKRSRRGQRNERQRDHRRHPQRRSSRRKIRLQQFDRDHR